MDFSRSGRPCACARPFPQFLNLLGHEHGQQPGIADGLLDVSKSEGDLAVYLLALVGPVVEGFGNGGFNLGSGKAMARLGQLADLARL